MKKIIFAVIALIGLGVVVFFIVKQYNQKKELHNYPNYAGHEDWSKTYYEKIQTKFDSCISKKDTNELRFLSVQLDTRLKMEDFLIEFREVEHIKSTLSGPFITSALTALISIVTTLLIVFFKQKQEMKSSPEAATNA